MKLMLFCCEENMLITGKNSVIMSSLSIENVYLFLEHTVGVVK